MNRSFGRALALLGGLALVALPLGCLVPNVRTDAPALPVAERDAYRLLGGEARSLAGCRYDYRVYEPSRAAGAGTADTVTVALGHGFLRDQDTLVGLARALANAGHRALTLDFCNMRPWNGHHVRNGADLRALAERVADGPIVYGGFSAGALAAVLAASGEGADAHAANAPESARADEAGEGHGDLASDASGGRGDAPPTLGVVTLDLVDQADLAANAVRGLDDVPLVGLQGPPSGCNAFGNGRVAFQRHPRSRLDTLAGASHCEFESPTDALCETFCGDEDADAEDERTRALIVERVLEAIDELASDHAAARPMPPGGAARM